MGKHEIPFRKKITDLLSEFGLYEADFCIGNGANDVGSEIALSKDNVDKEKHKYAIQYCAPVEVLCIWDIKRRIELNTALGLCWKGLLWKDVEGLQTKTIGIAKTKNKEVSAVAVMPVSYFRYFLKENADMGFKIDIPKTPGDLKGDKYYITGREGKKKEIYTTRYERREDLRRAAIEYHGYTCCACKFNFKENYGIDYIEVHHIRPLHTFEGEEPVDPIKDMVCLCANCHKVVHHSKEHTLSIDELKERISEYSKKDEEESS